MYAATHFKDKKMRMNMMDPSNGPYYIRTKEMQTTDKVNEKRAPRGIKQMKTEKLHHATNSICLYTLSNTEAYERNGHNPFE